MIRCVIPAWLVTVAGVAVAQPDAATIDGRVVDELGQPVAGASIELGDASAISDADGRFRVSGRGFLAVMADGFAPVTLEARRGMIVRLVRGTGEVIEISGSAEESKPLAYTLSAKDVATTPGAMNDALRAVTILPAASRIPLSFGGIVLRGMSPRDSSVLVDGVEIPLAFHFGGITGVFPTQALADMRVVPSGFDVSIGRTQGGAVELATRVPRGDTYRLGGEVSLLHSHASAEGPLFRDGAFLLTLRRSYLDVLARPFLSAEDPLPSYTDGQLRAVWGEPARRGQLAAYVFGSLDRFANSEDVAQPNAMDPREHIAANLGFVRAGASYKRRRGRDLLTLAPMVGTNLLTIYTKEYPPESADAKVVDLRRNWYVFGGRGEWLRDDDGGFVRAGLDVEGGYLGRVAQYAREDVGEEIALPRNTVLWTNAAAFVETRRHWYDEGLSVRPGLRLERFGLGEEWVLDPRVSGHVRLSETSTLRAALGRYHQPPSPAHFDEFADNLAAKSSYVDQGTVAIEIEPAEGVLATIAGFAHEGRKTLVDIADKQVRDTGLDLDRVFYELLEEQIGLYGYQDNLGRQRSYGIETSVRYDRPRFRLLANFSWSRAKRRYETGPWEVYGLDQPLRLNLLAATTARRWNIGARVTAVSGNPMHMIPAGTMFAGGDEPPAVMQRLPTFWQIDLRVDRTWKSAWGRTTLFFDLQNVTNHRNVEYRETDLDERNVYRNEDELGLPIIPYIGVELAPK